MWNRLPVWLKNKWALFALSAAATLLVGLLILFVLLRGAFAGTFAKQGAKALEEENYSLSAAKYKSALSMKKNKEEYFLGYGQALIGLGDYQKAVTVLEEGIGRFSGAESLYLCKVRALTAAGMLGEAVRFYDNVGNPYINKSIQAVRPGDLSYSPAQGSYSRAQKVTITCREGETVYYTLNGTDPTPASAVYKEPITVSADATLTAIAVREDGLVSPCLKATYKINNANEAIHFTDAKIEQMVRVALDRPYGNIYAAHLLSITDLSNQDVAGAVHSLKDLEYMPSLLSLHLNGEAMIEDWSPLAGLEALEILSVANCDLSNEDLTCINGLFRLRELTLDNNRISSLGVLQKLSSLEFLSVSHNELQTTSELSHFSKLKWLYLRNNRILNLSGLSALSELVTLDLADNYVSDLAPLVGLTQLTELYLNNNTPKNLKKLSSLPALCHIDVSGCGLVTLSVFNNYKALTALLAYNNRITSLSTFTLQVTELFISDNPLTDLSPLEDQTALRTLEARNLPVDDLSCLSKSTTLFYLDISGTDVTDASPLAGITSLQYLICTPTCSTAGLPDTVEIVVI